MSESRTVSPLATLRRLLRRPRGGEQTAVTVHVDAPSGDMTSNCSFRGWIAIGGGGPIGALTLVNDHGDDIPLARFSRRDVEQSMPGNTCAAFSGWLDVRTIAKGPWRLQYVCNGARESVPIALSASAVAAASFAESKARKLAVVRPLLRCPVCKTALADEALHLRCSAGHTFRAAPDAFDFLDAVSRANVGAVPTDNVSTHGYDPTLLELIAHSSGPILDVGSGLRPAYRDDVINVEIVPYPTTDVVAASEHLPFADETFDLVISVAVLEHVRDPFAAARELQRVLRPGGRVFAAAPFLVPYHAYPDHYYNMTTAGLRNLFSDLTVERLDVPASGGPIFALAWMLQIWRDHLPPDVAAEFENMRVADLAVDPMQLVSEPFVRRLSAQANVELAALNVLVGRKPMKTA